MLFTGLLHQFTEKIHESKVKVNSKTIPYLSKNFVGREYEMQELLATANFDSTEIKIIGIVGSPGFGKSTLAIQLGHRLIDEDVYITYIDMSEFPGENVQLVLAEKILYSESNSIVAKTVTFDRLLGWVRERYSYMILIL